MKKMYSKNVGDPSSEFGYCVGGERFAQKLQERSKRHEQLWNDFVAFMIANEVQPHELRTMFTRYYSEYLT